MEYIHQKLSKSVITLATDHDYFIDVKKPTNKSSKIIFALNLKFYSA